MPHPTLRPTVSYRGESGAFSEDPTAGDPVRNFRKAFP